jgi:hypothetical protein
MRYFKAVNKDDVTDEFYVSCNLDSFSPEYIQEKLGLLNCTLIEVGEQEFETMTQEENDYIINVGDSKDNLTPIDSAPDYESGVKKGEAYLEDWKYVELVYMPIDDDDTNTVVWFKARPEPDYGRNLK